MSASPSHSAAVTRTGSFPIGFRRGGSAWQLDLPAVLQWAAEQRFGVIDLGGDGNVSAPTAIAQGFRVGSVDLGQYGDWLELLSPDASVRNLAVQRVGAYVAACAPAGPTNHFIVMLPDKAKLPRAENFGYMVESFRALAPVFEAHQARLVIEGWPGPGALCCTPEGYQAFFEACPTRAFGVNFDPSHLVRMGINPLRFLRQFVDRVYHVHGKDTELLEEGAYQYGTLQEPTFGQPNAFGGMSWRYTIPGHGCAPWTQMLQILNDAGYAGAVSIELEDANFMGSPAAEQQGLLHARDFLTGC